MAQGQGEAWKEARAAHRVFLPQRAGAGSPLQDQFFLQKEEGPAALSLGIVQDRGHCHPQQASRPSWKAGAICFCLGRGSPATRAVSVPAHWGTFVVSSLQLDLGTPGRQPWHCSMRLGTPTTQGLFWGKELCLPFRLRSSIGDTGLASFWPQFWAGDIR